MLIIYSINISIHICTSRNFPIPNALKSSQGGWQHNFHFELIGHVQLSIMSVESSSKNHHHLMSSVANYFTLWVNARIPVGTSHANIVWKECETLHLTVYCIKPSFRASCLGQITLRQPPLLFWQERTWRLTSCIWPNLHRTTSLFLPFLQFYILPSRKKKKKNLKWCNAWFIYSRTESKSLCLTK